MVLTDTPGESLGEYGFDVPDPGSESETKQWYTVVLGAGVFATRAFSDEYALMKTEVYAQELRQGLRLETNGGFPLIMKQPLDEQTYRERVWLSTKPEVMIISLQEQSIITEPPEARPRLPYDPNQGRLF